MKLTRRTWLTAVTGALAAVFGLKKLSASSYIVPPNLISFSVEGKATITLPPAREGISFHITNLGVQELVIQVADGLISDRAHGVLLGPCHDKAKFVPKGNRYESGFPV